MATRRSDLGITQISLLRYRFQKVDYLPVMYRYETMLVSPQPKPVASYDTLWFPFDAPTWLFVLVATILQLLLLLLIERIWWRKTRLHSSENYMFEGNLEKLNICIN